MEAVGTGEEEGVVEGDAALGTVGGSATAAAGGRDTKKAAPGNQAPGMLCLRDGGLNDQELDDFTSSTVCVGWEIKRNIGLGDTVHMIKVSLRLYLHLLCLHEYFAPRSCCGTCATKTRALARPLSRVFAPSCTCALAFACAFGMRMTVCRPGLKPLDNRTFWRRQ